MSNNFDDNFWLSKIAGSKYFTSANDVRLLRYLVSATREDKILKETVIAIDVFGRDASFDPGSDSIVRSNIYNLRKKLNSYYLDEGNHDAVRFVIPKGSYRVVFKLAETEELEQTPELRVATSNSISFKFLFPVSFVLMLVFAFLYFSGNRNFNTQKIENKNPVWDYYLQSENPLIIVLGDYFMMQKTQFPDSSFNYVRNPEINSQNDFMAYLDKNPEQKASMKKLGQSYFGEEIPNCFFQLIQIFQKAHKPFSMKYASELSLSDVRMNDLIFVGDFGTLGILNPFFAKTGFHYSNIPPAIFILNSQQDTSEYISLNNPDRSVFQNDYAIVSNISAYDGKKIMFFVSFLPFGKSEALYKLSETSFLTELTDSVASFPDDWNLLMKISGLQSTGFYYEIIKFGSIE
ncbi:helix-turn-helix domain-containing protein [Labilibaculum sp. K2S]|uniref:helix-turn-helix domain-containing protein n=1 Tax=Labilibaculum sp. K2S TaxID=3056386 RepID=UPI0025A42621|nr:helix-turn-helix domain-containing protein [Labilibaculum sp. K2S]MDM8161600.1 helix-turn-helix domain-containing protein [Labilibaculum sp. K2S]